MKFRVWDNEDKEWVPERAWIDGDGILMFETDKEYVEPADPSRFVIAYLESADPRVGQNVDITI